MQCSRCNGRVFLDRTFSENMNYETFCIICGDRQFIGRSTRLGRWLEEQEEARLRERSLKH